MHKTRKKAEIFWPDFMCCPDSCSTLNQHRNYVRCLNMTSTRSLKGLNMTNRVQFPHLQLGNKVIQGHWDVMTEWGKVMSYLVSSNFKVMSYKFGFFSKLYSKGCHDLKWLGMNEFTKGHTLQTSLINTVFVLTGMKDWLGIWMLHPFGSNIISIKIV